MKEALWLALIALVLLVASVVRFAIRGQRRLGTPTQRAAHVALHTANLAAPALRTGLNADSTKRSISHLKHLIGVRALAMADLDGILALAEDMADIRAAEEARAEMRATGQSPIPWEQVKVDLGLA